MFKKQFAVFGLLAARSLCANVHFEISLTWEQGAPDGQSRDMIYTNGYVFLPF